MFCQLLKPLKTPRLLGHTFRVPESSTICYRTHPPRVSTSTSFTRTPPYLMSMRTTWDSKHEIFIVFHLVF